MTLKIYNTLTKKKETFSESEYSEIKMYVCGPTVYDEAHLGHARTYVCFDMIRRYLEHKGYSVKLVLNFTDIDDKIIKKSKETGLSTKEISDKYIKSFLEDISNLNIKVAYIYPRVSEHIEDIINFIEKLIDKGYGYISDDGVYFDTSKYLNYGQLGNIKKDSAIQSQRVKSYSKRNPSDFALWKFSEDEPNWESPWGRGRPAWHIECSVMSMKYLGETIHIHGGGNDLIFPHHENERAQSECYLNKEWVKYWIHTGYVMVNDEKMSKSLGNFITIKELLKRYNFEVIRLFLLQRHYRTPIEYSEKGLSEVEINLNKLYNTLNRIGNFLKYSECVHKLDNLDIETYEKIKMLVGEFYKCMDDDFNTPEALKKVYEIESVINKYLNQAKTLNKFILLYTLQFFNNFGYIFGILNNLENKQNNDYNNEINYLIDILINIRKELKSIKNYELSDKIRDDLKNIGIMLEDTPKGTIWKKVK